MSAWQVRKEGSPEVYALPTPAAVITAMRDGNFVPADEVKGPGDTAFQPLETHPTFAEAALDVEPPPAEAADDTHLDMNPLIDVCLVLLIFFILTITYASLERALDVPDDTPDDKGAQQETKFDTLKDRVFLVIVKMDGEKPVIKIGIPGAMKEVPRANDKLFDAIKAATETGRKEMLIDIEKDVPWGVETDILDAAKGNKIHNIINNNRGK